MTRQYSRFSGGVLIDTSDAVPSVATDGAATTTETPRRAAAVQPAPTAAAEDAKASWLLWVFLTAVVIPLEFVVGGLLITPARLLLLLTFPLFFLRWISGRYGGIKVMDWCIFGYSVWVVIAMMNVHGMEAIEFTGITVIETFAAYLVGRALVRNGLQFEAVCKFLKIFLIIMIPFTLFESVLANPIHLQFFSKLGRTYFWVSSDPDYGQRLGLWRAQGVFPHPILFGVFAATAFPLLFFTKHRKTGEPGRLGMAWPGIPITFLSLSSGAFLSLILSGGLAIWNAMCKTIKGHWMIMFWICVAMFVAIDLLSDRTPFEVFITYAAFSSHNGYMRINIFIFGMDNVWANPWFGLGLNDWARPRWLHAASVDNYWLLQAMRYGIPAFLLMVATWLVGIIGTARLKLHAFKAQAARRAWVISLVATTVSLVTVHMWGSLYIFMLFVLGMGVWLGDFAKSAENVPEAPEPKGRRRA